MTLHIVLTCLRHPLSWRRCLKEAAKRDPKVAEWREQRFAAVEANKQELRTMPNDPVTAAVMGIPQRRQRQGGGE